MYKEHLEVSFSTQRLTVDPDNSSHYIFTDNLSGCVCAIQPVFDEAMVGAGNLAQAFKFYTQETDIIVSDKIAAKGKFFTVKSVQNFDYGSEPHLEAIVSEEK